MLEKQQVRKSCFCGRTFAGGVCIKIVRLEVRDLRGDTAEVWLRHAKAQETPHRRSSTHLPILWLYHSSVDGCGVGRKAALSRDEREAQARPTACGNRNPTRGDPSAVADVFPALVLRFLPRRMLAAQVFQPSLPSTSHSLRSKLRRTVTIYRVQISE